MESGEVELSVLDCFIANKTDEDIKVELRSLYKFHDSAVESVLDGRGFKKTLKHIQDYINSRSQLDCAKIILKLKDVLKLTGDFKTLEVALVRSCFALTFICYQT